MGSFRQDDQKSHNSFLISKCLSLSLGLYIYKHFVKHNRNVSLANTCNQGANLIRILIADKLPTGMVHDVYTDLDYPPGLIAYDLSTHCIGN